MNDRLDPGWARPTKRPVWMAAAAIFVVAMPAHAADDEAHDGDRDDDDESKTHIAVDFDFNSAIDTPGTEIGGGGALRIGQKFRVPLLSFTPEVGGSYHAFTGTDDTMTYAGFLGGRLGIGMIVEPSIFGHVGLGRVEGGDARTALALDGGLAIDLTLLPLIDLGVHGGYNVMTSSREGGALKYVTLGAQVALVL